ncbi:hypothetical protein [Pseudomonas chlororaphis]|uniref:hypothetical protein n=1 Tax=Pseudomonas chlororaphis TaxID=587753 RepID=UPI0023685F2B|nr:hypothetical protein [Pseudomonas chlororaphis]WDH32850.1 hypothetical protein PUP62_18500 [Pseudomonas chlororaphis]WDH38932.1 hypothetical protein PUP51_18495 [Pseudomonas chlororaphis]
MNAITNLFAIDNTAPLTDNCSSVCSYDSSIDSNTLLTSLAFSTLGTEFWTGEISKENAKTILSNNITSSGITINKGAYFELTQTGKTFTITFTGTITDGKAKAFDNTVIATFSVK